ncbi:hypothetical protein PR048_020623 [Dryococelus australis]|uniref:Tc1-like transposase DDE domain-containing protein n=1 Tax=Dryococelus australis TaxID=614101 RepID=A0ABQ9H6V5_9NEOP|nr:hypothetical protein PR048_020623 [Dryococelus australis]
MYGVVLYGYVVLTVARRNRTPSGVGEEAPAHISVPRGGETFGRLLTSRSREPVRMTSGEYEAIEQQRNAWKSMDFTNSHTCGLFQQVNAQSQRAQGVRDWFKQHSEELQRMLWPPPSPEMNPIKRLWNQPDLAEKCAADWCFSDPSPERSTVDGKR